MKNKINFIYFIATLSCICSVTANITAQTVQPTDNKPDGSTVPLGAIPYPGIHDLTSDDKFNYIRTIVPDQPLQTLTGTFNYRQSTDYFDGLGRPLQTVIKKGHADGNDIVSVHVYDSLGRETYQYLPYAAPTGGLYVFGYIAGNIKLKDSTQMRGFYEQVGADEQPYSMNLYESSPLDRVVKQMAPGKSWVGSNRGVTYDYKPNREKEYVIGTPAAYHKVTGSFPRFSIGSNIGDVPQYAGNYSEGELYVTTVTDEDGKVSEEIKDKQGKIIIKRSLFTKHDALPYPALAPTTMFPNNFIYTIYVYDDRGRLRAVLPPEVCQPLMTLSVSGFIKTFVYTWNVTTQQYNGLCTQYFYDNKDRLTQRKIPGKEVEFYAYDKKDRQIFYQDGNLRQEGKWRFTFFDVLDRPTSSGVSQIDDGAYTLTGLQDLLNSNITNGLAYYFNKDLYHEYPISGSYTKVLTYTYYDDYSYDDLSGFSYDYDQFANITIPNSTVVAPQEDASNMTRGMPTGSKVRVMDPDDPDADNWLTSVNYYDNKGRIIQTQSWNLKGGLDMSSNVYYFQGMLYKNILKLQNESAVAIDGATDGQISAFRVENTFDRNLGTAGGSDETWLHRQKINGGIDYHLSAYGYDHLGRAVLKQFTAGINYQDYNIHGGFSDIIFNKNELDTAFQERLFYDKGFASKLYNGNIAGIIWAGNDQVKKAYGYSYDMLNRLNHAEFRQLINPGNPIPDWSNTDMDYTASNITYDLNGNIKSMKQQVKVPGVSTPIPFTMDQLTYDYVPNSNQLSSVEDAITPSQTEIFGLPDFKDNAHSSDEYHFDHNGNMIQDANKGIGAITYNYLNKPEKIIVDGKGEITYVYDAAGNKLQKRVLTYSPNNIPPGQAIPPPINEVWDYIGNFVFKDNQLQCILNEEGRARPIAATGNLVPANSATPNPTIFVYDYFVKDHLGNVRSTVTSTPNAYEYAARHEIVSANTEELIFDNIPLVRADKPASISLDDKYAARLNAGDGKSIGTAIMLHVNAGDRLQFSVNAFYSGEFVHRDEIGSDAILESLASALVGGQNYSGVPISELPENAAIVQNIFSSPGLASQIADITNSTNDPNAPKAHLNYLFFNEHLELQGEYSRGIQVPANIDGIGSWTTIGDADWPTTTGGVGGGRAGHEWNGGFVPQVPGILLVYIDNQSIGQDVWFDNLVVNHYLSSVVEEDHYYPYGLCLNTQEIEPGVQHQAYKYNGIELEKHFGLEINEALYRTDDPQIGRLWQIDPKFAYELSPYSSRANNPALFSDPLGDTTQVYGRNGALFGTVNDNLPNQIHFLSIDADGTKAPWTLSNGKTVNANAWGKKFREISTAYMGENSAADLQEMSKGAENAEVGFVATISSTKELRFTKLSDKYRAPNDNNGYLLKTAIQETFSWGEQRKLFAAGHFHPTSSSNAISVNGFTGDYGKLLELGEPTGGPNSNYGDADYQPMLMRNNSSMYPSQSAAFIGTKYGFSIYGTGTDYTDGYASDKIMPSVRSFYQYKQLKK
jgi:hypothetical protein